MKFNINIHNSIMRENGFMIGKIMKDSHIYFEDGLGFCVEELEAIVTAIKNRDN